ncbi:VOC family protein [Paenibacillus sp. DMB20]|uniref:VOC family protein n=1 Tax=Paenibacillus sp. DMB20 TaxID=1642570 RepID=UPI000AD07717
MIHLFVPNVDDWYSELKNKKEIRMIEPPNEDIEGLRMMTITDPDGNQLRICTRC